MTQPLSTIPWDVSTIVSAFGVHVIDAAALAPGVCRLTVLAGQERAAANALIQAGYDATVSRTRPQTVLAVVPEDEDDES